MKGCQRAVLAFPSEEPMQQSLPTLDNRALPERITRLRELAYNLWWSWHEEAQVLFQRIDPLLWEATSHNPVAFLRRADHVRLEHAAEDVTYLAIYNKIFRAFDMYMAESDTWFTTTYPNHKHSVIAYFSTEFGLHESLPLYAGGLGVLSGDHAKEASDLGLPFVGVGLLYYKGYFTQKINADGWQEDVYNEFDPQDRPIHQVAGADGSAACITLSLGDLTISSKIWKVQVGRIPIYLLDTSLDSSNPQATQDIPRLYGGSHITRLLQEMLLGIGGIRSLRLLGIQPTVWHMNEGHSSFLTLELLRERVKAGAAFDDAVAHVASEIVFTTHTPVPAGLDMFEMELIAPYFEALCTEIGISTQQFVDLGRQDMGWGEKFSMPQLALRLSSFRNGVSAVHGQVSRELFQHVWPNRAVEQIPITHITNGVHAQTWLSPRMTELFDRYIGADWVAHMDDPQLWSAVDAIPDDVLWDVRRSLKSDLLWLLRNQAQKRWASGEIAPTQLAWAGTMMRRNALTIGFARRFATYKRATLLFRDVARLQALTCNEERPVQFVFSGKAHPHDEGGKQLIQEICRQALDPKMGGAIAFLEDYDMNVARYLVRGVDVWLNNPRRPREASGTSGQKAAINGVPNLSVLDGWWAEGFNQSNGWAIGDGKVYTSEDEEDRDDSDDLYRTLENDVIPLYFQRDESGIPRQWLAMVREAIKSSAPNFTTRRMVKEYTRSMYVPVLNRESGSPELSW